jgi:hypothetical protein
MTGDGYSVPAACGTYGGYQRHVRHGETPCMRCKVARAQYAQDRRLAPQRRRVLLAALAGYDLETP